MKKVNRKHLPSLVLFFAGCFAVVNPALSGPVTYPDNSYSTNQILTATDLNNKFNQIKSAINIGSASIAPHAFSPEYTSATQVTDCVLTRNESSAYAYFQATGTNTGGACDAVAGIQLPNGVTLTGMSCKVFDNAGQPTPGNHILAYLWRSNISGGASATVNAVFSTPQSVDSTNEQILSDTTPATGTAVVDNSTYTYFVTISYITNDFSAATGYGIAQRFYGCSVSYN